MRKKIFLGILFSVVMLLFLSTKVNAVDFTNAEVLPFTREYDGNYTYSTIRDGICGEYVYYYNHSESTSKSCFSIYKHHIFDNTNEKVYESEDGEHINKTIIRNNVLYVYYLTNYQPFPNRKFDNKVSIVGIDMENGEQVYSGSFNITPDLTYQCSFTVDDNHNFYFMDKDGVELKIFNSTGTLIYSHDFSSDLPRNEVYAWKMELKGVSPNNRILFFDLIYGALNNPYYMVYHEGMQKINNGRLETDKLQLFSPAYGVYWGFLDDNYAVSQKGIIGKFDYDSATEEGLLTYLRETEHAYLINWSINNTPPNYCVDGDYIYLMNDKLNNIYKIRRDGENFTIEGYFETDFNDYINCEGFEIIDGKIVFYTTGMQVAVMDMESNFVPNYSTSYERHISESRSIQDIVNKYKATLPSYDYNNSIYKVAPSLVAPYNEGSLKDEVVNDTLNKINYYRWLIGEKEISINKSKMARNQKGALLLKTLNVLTHNPKKPSGMSDAFFQDAYDGCNAKHKEGDTYSGNVASGDKAPYQCIQGYIDDLNNIVMDDVGHRNSILDYGATGVSFGHVENYNTTSVYYEDDPDVSEGYYAYPSAGNFPLNELATQEYWSLYITGNEIGGNVNLQLTYNGKKYKLSPKFSWDYSRKIIYFKLPEELRKQFGSKPAAGKYIIELNGLEDENCNPVFYKYTVNLFDINKYVITFSDVKKSDWFYNAVDYVYLNNIIKGYNNYNFAPNDNLTRGMLVTILYRMEGEKAVSGTPRFPDVKDSSKYYFKAVKWATDNKIVNGYQNGCFGPEDNITREQLAVMLNNYARYKKKNVSNTNNLSKFKDAGSVSSYAVPAMKWAVGSGVITGNSNGTLNPQGNATRAEAAAMLEKYCKRVGR